MNSNDWAKLWIPLAAELAKALFGLIFGKEKIKTKIFKTYRGEDPRNKMEGTNYEC